MNPGNLVPGYSTLSMRRHFFLIREALLAQLFQPLQIHSLFNVIIFASTIKHWGEEKANSGNFQPSFPLILFNPILFYSLLVGFDNVIIRDFYNHLSPWGVAHYFHLKSQHSAFSDTIPVCWSVMYDYLITLR